MKSGYIFTVSKEMKGMIQGFLVYLSVYTLFHILLLVHLNL